MHTVTHGSANDSSGHAVAYVNVKSNVEKEHYVIRYHELLQRKVAELRTDVKTFFRMAHVNQFGTDPDVQDDIGRYKIGGIIPVYVQRYLDTLEAT